MANSNGFFPLSINAFAVNRSLTVLSGAFSTIPNNDVCSRDKSSQLVKDDV